MAEAATGLLADRAKQIIWYGSLFAQSFVCAQGQYVISHGGLSLCTDKGSTPNFAKITQKGEKIRPTEFDTRGSVGISVSTKEFCCQTHHLPAEVGSPTSPFST